MDFLFIFITGFLIGITGAIIPGPLTFFTVSEVLKTDRFAALKIISGHIAIEFFIISLIYLGLHKFLDSEPLILAVSIIGGIALSGMGILLCVKSPHMKLMREEKKAEFSSGLFLGGIFFSLASPGFIIWWLTIGVSTVMRALLFGIAGLAILSLGHWSADVMWYWSVSYALDKGKSRLTDYSYRNIVKVSAVSLILLGIFFITKNHFLG